MKQSKTILSLHWGLSLGGVAKYAAILDRVDDYVDNDLEIHTVCVLPKGRIVDMESLSALYPPEIIRVRSPLDVRWVSQLRKIVARVQPDALISHGFNGHLMARLAATRNVRRLASYHGSYHAPSRNRRMLEPIFNGYTHWYFRQHVDAVACVAEHSMGFLANVGVPAERLTVVHNGINDIQVDADSRTVLRKQWQLSADDLVIGVASRLDPIKGLNYLLDACAPLMRQYESLHLVLIGEGSCKNALMEQAERLGITKRLRFTGMRDDVSRCLCAMDIFALPSLAEYHSIGLLEAMRAGLPIVATDVGGNTESVRNEQEGLIVPASDSVALHKALQRLIEQPDLRASLSESARKRFLTHFTEQAMLQNMASWIKKAIA